MDGDAGSETAPLDKLESEPAPIGPAASPGDEALACVRWDGTVDARRLLRAEFAHNLAVATAALASHAATLRRAKTSALTGGPHTLLLERDRDAGCWSAYVAGRYPHQGRFPFGDHDMACLGALRARRPDFALIRIADALPSPGVGWSRTWLASVVADIGSRSGAWNGASMASTHHLSRWLLDLVSARLATGGSNVNESVDDISSPDVERALRAASQVDTEAAALADQWFSALPPMDQTDIHRAQTESIACARETRAVLATLVGLTQRLYDTPAIYLAHIAPAEYEGLCGAALPGVFIP